MRRPLFGLGLMLAIASQGCVATALGLDRPYSNTGPRVLATPTGAASGYRPPVNQAMYGGAVPGHWGSGPSIRR